MRTGNIVVLGSFVVGLTVRLPRMPVVGETLPADLFDVGPGGKGTNLAVAASRLGAHVSVIGRIGDDDFGKLGAKTYSSEGIDTRYVMTDPVHPTAVGLVYLMPNGENTIGVYRGANWALSAEDVWRASEAIAKADLVTAQLEVPDAAVEALIMTASEAGTPVLLNPAPARLISDELLQRVDVLTPNEGEARILVGQAPGDQSRTMDDVAEELLSRGPRALVVTLGAAGARVYRRHAKPESVPALKVNAIDTVGAGDAFNGALAVALTEGRPLLDAVIFANRAAGIATMGVGAIPPLPRRRDVDALEV